MLYTFCDIYPFILNDETMKNMEEVMKTMPPEFLKAFNKKPINYKFEPKIINVDWNKAEIIAIKK